MKEKKCTIFKRVFSLAMAVFMTLMLAMPAMVRSEVASAAGEYSITIKNTDKLAKMENGQFKAYQVFSGKLTTTDNQLSDIQWGSGVGEENGVLIAEALKTASADESNVLYGCFNPTKDVLYNASYIAKCLSEINEKTAAELPEAQKKEILQAFAKIVNEHLTSTCVLSQAQDDGSTSYIPLDDPGYYLVVQDKEKPGVDEGTVVSEFILEVLGNDTVTVKADIPTVDKEIVTDGGTAKGDSAGIGDTVQFKLTGTLPDNYSSYEKYYYAFHDTLSNGLDYVDGSIKVTVVYKDKSKPSKVIFEGTESKDIGPEGNIIVNANSTDRNITITIDDLKKTVIDLAYGDTIVVEYSATLNENAIVGSTDANNNTVYLEYSNDPNSDGKGKTTTEIVYEYVFGLNITKNNDSGSALPGAGFVLQRVEDSKYAEFGEATGDDMRRLTGWTDGYTDASGNKANCLLQSDAAGHFNIEGLGAGKYVLKEVVTPDGYNTMADIEFEIVPVINPTTGELESVSIVVTKLDTSGDGKVTDDDVDRDDATAGSGDVTEGLIPMTLVNHKAPTLPNTGGIGTIIFYVAGGLLLAGAAVYLVVSRTRKETK